MKKKIFSVALVAVIALGAGWNVMQSENEMNLSDLALGKVEALASSECISQPSGNTGTCKGDVGSSGNSCVKAGTCKE